MAPIDSAERPEVAFKEIHDVTEPTQVESLCVNCEQNGMTTLLLTKIPHYKEVIIMSFRCDHCGFANSELQSGARIQDKGIVYKVQIEHEQDLNRQVVKAETASCSVPEIELEIPAKSQPGVVTTIEGILQRTINGLLQDQPVRRHMAPEDAQKIDEYVDKVKEIMKVEKPFSMILRDISGNSFVENRFAPEPDPQREITHFTRTREEDHELGIYTQDELNAAPAAATSEASTAPLASTEASSPTASTSTQDSMPANAQLTSTEVSQKLVQERAHQLVGNSDNNEIDLSSEVLVFNDNCPSCNAPCKTNMKITQIPHFKEVVIMATLCDSCGHKTNEVKSGGGIEPKGKRMTLKVQKEEDLSRDLLKSETCNISIPELKFEMGGFAIGGRFTTLEGLLESIDEQVANNPLVGAISQGDSATDEVKQKMEEFHSKLKLFKDGKEHFTLILDDPAGNSYLQNLCLPDEDPQLQVEHYERSYEQNDELGLNDMKTENYGEKPKVND